MPGYHQDKLFSGTPFKVNASDSNIQEEETCFPEVMPFAHFPLVLISYYIFKDKFVSHKPAKLCLLNPEEH